MSKRRAVVWSEALPKGDGSAFQEWRVYEHYFRVRLSCGHYSNARPIEGGDCPATVTCEQCDAPTQRELDRKRRGW